MPLYGRSFSNTEGPGTSFQGVGKGSWEHGVYDYKALPLPSSKVLVDKNVVASWCYHPNRKEMVSYDSVEIAKMKAAWIIKQGFGGSMYWELSGDHLPKHPDSIVHNVALMYKQTPLGLDSSPNHLKYNSKFDNLRKGM